MKLYEKTLVTICVITIILQLLVFPGKSVLLAFTIWLLSASYFVGGYWLFESKDYKEISILSGVVFSLSLFSLPHLIWLNRDNYYNYLPIANGVLILYLIVKIFLAKTPNDYKENVKPIFIRSLTILLLSSFFTYSPISFKPYRSVLYALNNGRDHIQANLKMFDYTEECNTAIEQGECDKAIHFGLLANKEGLTWLGASLNTSNESNQSKSHNGSNEIELWRISGTYSNLYEAYKCKADKLYENEEFEKALDFYIKSDKSLTNYANKSKFWKTEQAYSKNALALCYQKLNKYEFADSLFVEAIEHYKESTDTIDKNIAIIYSNLGDSMGEQSEFKYSNIFYKIAIQILQKENSKKAVLTDLIKNHHNLIENYIKTDSLVKAKIYIDKTRNLIDEGHSYFCNTKLYEGLYYFKKCNYKKADEILFKNIDCFNNLEDSTNLNQNNLILAQIKIILAEYKKAKSILNVGIEKTRKDYGEKSLNYANFLKVDAHLDKAQGFYHESERKYNTVLKIYNSEFGDLNSKAPVVLSSLSDLDIILSKYDDAKTHSDDAISIAKKFVEFKHPSVTNLINQSAYVSYSIGNLHVSDSLYQASIKINETFNLNSSTSTAIALNGLGLIQTAKSRYKIADSLFTQSLKLHKTIFSDNHPFTAIVYLNKGILKIKQNKLKEASNFLSKSLEINKRFLEEGHDIYADIYVAFGDLSVKKNKLQGALKYYKKALNIYINKFGENHFKVINLKKKINGSS